MAGVRPQTFIQIDGKRLYVGKTRFFTIFKIKTLLLLKSKPLRSPDFMRKALYLGTFFLVFSFASAQVPYQTHSLYIYSFGKFIQWPEENREGDFEIAVLGDSPILPELDKLAQKKKIGDRTIRIVRISSIKEFKKSQILFLPEAQSATLSDFIQKVGNHPTLIVTEQAGLGAKGSDINFLVKDGKLVFELNQNSLTKHKLKAANELTRLAIII